MFNINYLIIKQYSLLPKEEVKSNMASCVTVSGAYALVVYLSKKKISIKSILTYRKLRYSHGFKEHDCTIEKEQAKASFRDKIQFHNE